MNVKAKRRAAVPAATRQESAPEAGAKETAGAAKWGQAAADFPSQGGLILSDHLHDSKFIRLQLDAGKFLPCNPSIAKDDKGNLAVMVRCVNYLLGDEDGIWFRDDPGPDTQNYFSFLDDDLGSHQFRLIDDLEVRRMRAPAQNGLEDGRLFWWRNGWWFLSTALHHGPRVRGTMSLAQLEDCRVGHFEFLHSPHGREIEKNWAPCVDGDRLSVVYSHHPAESYELAPNRRRLQYEAFLSLASWSGSSQLIRYDGSWVSVVHQRRKHKNRVYYVHRMVRYDENLAPVHVGREFRFRGDQVEFCAGLVEHRGEYVMSFGVKDREAWLVRITASQLATLLHSE